jgi:hypothetical protein
MKVTTLDKRLFIDARLIDKISVLFQIDTMRSHQLLLGLFHFGNSDFPKPKTKDIGKLKREMFALGLDIN